MLKCKQIILCYEGAVMQVAKEKKNVLSFLSICFYFQMIDITFFKLNNSELLHVAIKNSLSIT